MRSKTFNKNLNYISAWPVPPYLNNTGDMGIFQLFRQWQILQSNVISNWVHLFETSCTSFLLVFSSWLVPAAAEGFVSPSMEVPSGFWRWPKAWMRWLSQINVQSQTDVCILQGHKLLQRSPIVLLGDFHLLSLEVVCSSYTQTYILFGKYEILWGNKS